MANPQPCFYQDWVCRMSACARLSNRSNQQLSGPQAGSGPSLAHSQAPTLTIPPTQNSTLASLHCTNLQTGVTQSPRSLHALQKHRLHIHLPVASSCWWRRRWQYRHSHRNCNHPRLAADEEGVSSASCMIILLSQ